MPLTNDEKICAKAATRFLHDMQEELGFTKGKLLADNDLVSGGPFFGEVAADKYRECMQNRRNNSKKAAKTR